jgi:flagellar biosynthesis/type III secretory pathway M-ring protein FliF/YscJ
VLAATPTASPVSSNPLNALTVIFAIFAVLLLVLFVLTGILSAWNRSQRRQLEREKLPDWEGDVQKIDESGAETEEPTPPARKANKKYDESLDERARFLTIGDLVMSEDLRETYQKRSKTWDNAPETESDT